MDFNLSEVQKMLQNMVRDFTVAEVEPRAKEIDRTDEYPHDLVKRLGELDLFGLPFPEKYGGVGMGYLDYVLAVEQISQSSPVVAWALTNQSNAEEAIFGFGTEEQKEKYLKRLTKGQIISCFAFTEPATGTDPRSIQTNAKLSGDEYILNGEKRFITRSPVAQIAIVFAKTEDERVSAFIVETDQPGFTTSKPWEKMGYHGSATADVFLEDVKVPKQNLIGATGDGFKVLLQSEGAAKLGWCAMALGIAKRALDESIKYANERTVRGKPIAKLLNIQWLITEIAAKVEMIRWSTYRVACMKDESQSIHTELALAKMIAATACVQATSLAVQVHGGYGYVNEFKVEQLYRDAKLHEVVGGSVETQRLIIAGGLLR